MEVPDFWSRHQISKENPKLFETEIGNLGICVRSRRVLSLDVKDPKIEILARVASGDQNYLSDLTNIEQQVGINHISKESEVLLGRPRHCLTGQWLARFPARSWPMSFTGPI